MNNVVRILVADDHEVVRRGVCALLEGHAGFEVCDEAVDGREAVEKAKRSLPDVVILDIGMPGLNGFDAARQIRKVSPASEVLILTMHESEQVIGEVLAAGARGYVLKSDAGRDLVTAVEALSRHKTFFTSSVAEMVLQKYLEGNPESATHETSSLTPREREVVQLVAEGRTNKEVAELLSISPTTVETHRGHILQKLDIHNTAELVLYAVRRGVIS